MDEEILKDNSQVVNILKIRVGNVNKVEYEEKQ
jgi:hypothetical protein